jgi:glucose/arabinose dehydrogenase/PKD repeat protein
MRRGAAHLVAVAASATFAAGPSLAVTPPAGFQDSVVATAVSPTAIAYEPGSGSLFIVEKGSGTSARVLRRDAVSGTITTALTLPCVDTNGERGGLGIAFDPDYTSSTGNRWVYLYYTRLVPASGACMISGTTGSRNRIVRYLEGGGVLQGEQVLLEGPVLTTAINHNGGTLRFAPDKTLYASMGDNDSDADPAPFSRDLSDLRGKILRITSDGAIPVDNPFVGQLGKRPEIFAWGLRNPFRFSVDPLTGTPWIADVGENTWEEIDLGVPGADYGYPCFEGNAAFRTCNPAPASPTFPAFVYGHPGQNTPFSGYSITGGPVYRGGNFPASYQGRLFFGDYGGGWIRHAALGPGNSLSDVTLFMDNVGNVVDIVQAPSGCLAWVNIYAGEIHETCSTGGSNGAPSAIATATPVFGLAPLDVQFSGSASSDPDGDPLAYAWAFGDGAVATASDPAHTYAGNGVYTAALTVDDGRGAVNSSSVSGPIRIVVGNRAPIPAITAPVDGSHYDAGDVIAFAGGATDPEDGALAPAKLDWSVVFHHDAHTHPFLPSVPGVASSTFTIPTSGEDAVNVWYRIHLTGTDSGSPVGAAAALSASTYVDIFPNVATITLEASPAGQGLQLSFAGTTAAAPVSHPSVVNFPRTIDAPTPQSAGGRTWAFAHWTDAAAGRRTIATPAVDTTYAAVFRCIAGCSGLDDADGDGFTTAQGDCDDSDPATFPGAPDLCDGKNNDCTGTADDAVCSTFTGSADRVDGVLLSLLGRYFGVCDPDPSAQPWGVVDYTKDGCLDGNDLAVMGVAWGCGGSTPLCR